jgi:hypothetical protein
MAQAAGETKKQHIALFMISLFIINGRDVRYEVLTAVFI